MTVVVVGVAAAVVTATLVVVVVVVVVAVVVVAGLPHSGHAPHNAFQVHFLTQGVLLAAHQDLHLAMTFVVVGLGLGFGLKLGGVVVVFLFADTGCAGCSATYGYLKDKTIYSPFEYIM